MRVAVATRPSFGSTFRRRTDTAAFVARTNSWNLPADWTRLFSSSSSSSSSFFISPEQALQAWHEGQQQQSDQTDKPHADEPRRVQFVDASWYHKGPAHLGRTQFEQGPRIPGSTYFDLTDISSSNPAFAATVDEREPQLSAMLPSPELFGFAMDTVIGGGGGTTTEGMPTTTRKPSTFVDRTRTHVILYGVDRVGLSFVPRAWFTFWAMHHVQLSILDGTLLDDWKGPLDTTPTTVPWLSDFASLWTNTKQPQQKQKQDDEKDGSSPSTLFYPSRYFGNSPATAPMDLRPGVVATADQVLQNPKTGQPNLVLDARGSSFAQTGHMPGAKHVPYSTLMALPQSSLLSEESRKRPEEATPEFRNFFKDRASLRQLFQDATTSKDDKDPITTTQTVVCSCGTGVSACSLYLALLECGRTHPTVLYDGSWQEWKQLDDMPKVLAPQTAVTTS